VSAHLLSATVAISRFTSSSQSADASDATSDKTALQIREKQKLEVVPMHKLKTKLCDFTYAEPASTLGGSMPKEPDIAGDFQHLMQSSATALDVFHEPDFASSLQPVAVVLCNVKFSRYWKSSVRRETISLIKWNASQSFI
jgi:hypothetical protein